MSKLYRYHCIRTPRCSTIDEAFYQLENGVNRFLASQIKTPLPVGGPNIILSDSLQTSYIAYQSFMVET